MPRPSNQPQKTRITEEPDARAIRKLFPEDLVRFVLARKKWHVKEVDPRRLAERFGSEAKCGAYLEKLRWPRGVACPRCRQKKISRSGERYRCQSCQHQFTVTSGTMMHDTHLPLWIWVLSAYALLVSASGANAHRLSVRLGINNRTARRIRHQIISACRTLSATVEVSDRCTEDHDPIDPPRDHPGGAKTQEPDHASQAGNDTGALGNPGGNDNARLAEAWVSIFNRFGIQHESPPDDRDWRFRLRDTLKVMVSAPAPIVNERSSGEIAAVGPSRRAIPAWER